MGIKESNVTLEISLDENLGDDRIDLARGEFARIKGDLVSLYTEFCFRPISGDLLGDLCSGVSNILGLTDSLLYVILEDRWVSTLDEDNGDLNFIIYDNRTLDFVSFISAIKIKSKQGPSFSLEKYTEASITTNFFKKVK